MERLGVKVVPKVGSGSSMKGLAPSSSRTWVIDADTKLDPSSYIGARTATDALDFMRDVASRLDNRVQLTTDGLQSYLIAVDRAFEGEID